MATLQISDELDLRLQAAALRQSCSVEEVIQVLLYRSAEEAIVEPLFTEALSARIKESSAQASRGETVSSEAVDKIFNDFFRSLEARKNAA